MFNQDQDVNVSSLAIGLMLLQHFQDETYFFQTMFFRQSKEDGVGGWSPFIKEFLQGAYLSCVSSPGHLEELW